MKKRLRVFISLVLVGVVLAKPTNLEASDSSTYFIDIPVEQIDIKASSENETTVFAEESLASCDLGIGINKNGVGVTFTTRATTEATEIGCKDIVLQEKTTLGWKDITIRDHYTYDSDYYMGSVVYLKAEVGKTYRVYCTHYAIINDEEYTLYNITDSIVYN